MFLNKKEMSEWALDRILKGDKSKELINLITAKAIKAKFRVYVENFVYVDSGNNVKYRSLEFYLSHHTTYKKIKLIEDLSKKKSISRERENNFLRIIMKKHACLELVRKYCEMGFNGKVKFTQDESKEDLIEKILKYKVKTDVVRP